MKLIGALLVIKVVICRSTFTRAIRAQVIFLQKFQGKVKNKRKRVLIGPN